MDGGSEDVNEFLLRIRELGDKRVKEDEERTRKLEEEILQGRKERQARRAERARSISPTKDLPLSPTSKTASINLSDDKKPTLLPSHVLQPSGNSFEHDTLSSLKTYCADPHHDDSEKSIPSTPLAGKNPQPEEVSSATQSGKESANTEKLRDQTPQKDQPASLETPDTVAQSNDTMSLEEDTTPSRSQISQALSSKDPTWFRQTADREKSSLALRKNAENTMFDAPSIGGNYKLPGLSRESTAEPEKARDWVGDDRSRSPSRASSTFAANSSIGNRYSSMSSVSTSGLGSPVPLSTQRFDARKMEAQPSIDDRAPLSPGRASPERSSSPTKGLGGFVQSAMLKRSDSISKRWSVQSPANLSRSNSIVSNRSGVGRSGFGGDILPDSKPIRENSPLSPSRPNSSHSEATVVHHSKHSEAKDNDQEKIQLDTGFAKSSLPIHTRTSVSSTKAGADDAKPSDSDPQTPRSPSKSFDQKRWSPTKSTWLESALNRPESPRTKSTPVTQQQPAWLRDLSKARQARASVDLGKPAANNDATPSSSARSSQLVSHSKSPSVAIITTPTIEESVNPAAEEIATPVNDKNDQSSTTDIKDDTETTPNDSTEAAAASGIDKTPSSTSKPPPPALPTKPKSISATDLGSSNSKPQPATLDFRSNLRRRETNNDSNPQEEPEFKNVFGKLRKAEKSNYKAPDTFKDNIMKGKAALNVTGGPKKSDRVDEFKESILKQKDAMKAGGGSIRRTGEENRSPPKPTAPIPEALARRSLLTRTDSTKSNLSSLSSTSPTKSSDIESRQRPLSVSAGRAVGESPSIAPSSQSPLATHAAEPKKRSTTDTIANGGEKELEPEAETLPKVLTKEEKNKETGPPVRPLPSKVSVEASTKTTAEPRGLATKGKIADRVNPALAGFLSRGPPRAGGETETSAKIALSTSSPASSAPKTEPTSTAPLTHMTKARARGPKRRLPTSSKSETKQVTEEGHRSKTESIKKTESVSELTERKSSSENVGPPPVPAKKPDARSVLPSIPDEPAVERQKPLIPTKSPDLPRSSIKPPALATETPVPKEKSVNKETPTVPKSNTSPAVPPKSGSLPESSMRSSNERPTPPPKSATLPSTPATESASVSPSFASKLKDTIVNSASASPLQARFGLGLGGSYFQSRPESPLDTKKPSQLNKSSASPPVPRKKNLTINPKVSNEPRRPSLTSPVPRTSESVGVISDFFDTLPKTDDRVDIDPELVLNTETDELKTRTIQKQIWEITGDGKKQDLPKHQEDILFEGSMYVCVHSFECETGKRTEAYLWLGDEVAEAAMEDAQLFARRVARDNGAKLELVRQGKEPAKFIEALGGIIITRRGSSSRSSSSALYMLRGRRHLGQIAFDEVDISRQNLCSGFPFVISAKFGKLYLWKGKGSGADEIGSARLIGMNLGLTGEIEEFSEGEEPQSFFDAFPDSETVEPCVTSEHWHLKPKHDKYRCRLLRIDHMLGKGFWNRHRSSSPVTRPNDTIQEIDPFCQKDLRAGDIYILDSFFEVYVIVGNDAKSRPAEFASALVFAHEYGILAASVEDRPFIPKSFVAIGGMPDSCKVAFRKWDRNIWPTTPHVLPLNAAIEAIRP